MFFFTGARNHYSATNNSEESNQAENKCLPPPPKKNRKILYSTVFNELIHKNSSSPSMVMDEFEAVGGSLAFVQLIRIWG